MKKTIIITGGHFIGKNLIKYLKSYYNIVNIDNSSLKSPFKDTEKDKVIKLIAQLVIKRL